MKPGRKTSPYPRFLLALRANKAEQKEFLAMLDMKDSRFTFLLLLNLVRAEKAILRKIYQPPDLTPELKAAYDKYRKSLEKLHSATLDTAQAGKDTNENSFRSNAELGQ